MKLYEAIATERALRSEYYHARNMVMTERPSIPAHFEQVNKLLAEHTAAVCCLDHLRDHKFRAA